MTSPTSIQGNSSPTSLPPYLVNFEALAPQIQKALQSFDWDSLSEEQWNYLHSKEVNNALRNEPDRQFNLGKFQSVPDKYLEDAGTGLSLALNDLQNARFRESEQDANDVKAAIENMRCSGLFFLPPHLLHEQTVDGTAENVEILLGFGADVNATEKGYPPIRWAIDKIGELIPELQTELAELAERLIPDPSEFTRQLDQFLPARVRNPYQKLRDQCLPQNKTELAKLFVSNPLEFRRRLDQLSTDQHLLPNIRMQELTFEQNILPFFPAATKSIINSTGYSGPKKMFHLIVMVDAHSIPKLNLLEEWVDTAAQTAQEKYPNLFDRRSTQNQDQQTVGALCEEVAKKFEAVQERFEIIKVLLNKGADPTLLDSKGVNGLGSFFVWINPETGRTFEDDQTIGAELYNLLTLSNSERAGTVSTSRHINPDYRG